MTPNFVNITPDMKAIYCLLLLLLPFVTEAQIKFELVPSLGYVFTDDHKVKAGLVYRLDSFLRGGARSTLWLTVSRYR